MDVEARIPLVCTYDSHADAAYIYLDHPVAGGAARQTVSADLDHGMANLDLDADGRVLGLEIIGARRHLPPALLDVLVAAGERASGTREA